MNIYKNKRGVYAIQIWNNQEFSKMNPPGFTIMYHGFNKVTFKEFYWHSEFGFWFNLKKLVRFVV
jgi:hypothetical protein